MNAVEQHYAKEAERLLADDTLATAMTVVRTQALVALSTVDASDTKEILRLQAIANCLADVRDQLEAAIKAMGSADGGFDPNKPTSEG
jgi:hypothetical protein